MCGSTPPLRLFESRYFLKFNSNKLSQSEFVWSFFRKECLDLIYLAFVKASRFWLLSLQNCSDQKFWGDLLGFLFKSLGISQSLSCEDSFEFILFFFLKDSFVFFYLFLSFKILKFKTKIIHTLIKVILLWCDYLSCKNKRIKMVSITALSLLSQQSN